MGRKKVRKQKRRKQRKAEEQDEAEYVAMMKAGEFQDQCIADFRLVLVGRAAYGDVQQRWRSQLGLLGVSAELARYFIAQAVEAAADFANYEVAD